MTENKHCSPALVTLGMETKIWFKHVHTINACKHKDPVQYS